MGASSFDLTARLGVNASQYVSGTKQAATATDSVTEAASKATTAGDKWASKLDQIGKAAAAAFAAKKIFDFASSAVKSFSDLNESGNAVEVVFESAAGSVLAFGEEAPRSVGLATSAYQQMAAQTGQLLQGLGVGLQDSATLTQRLTERSADMASVMNTSVEDALMAVQGALRGETEPIRRFIGDMSIASVEAFALEAGIIKAGEALEGEAKALATVEFIMSKTNKMAGDFANTSDGLANRQKILAAEWETQKALIGEQLAPAWAEVLGVMTDLMPIAGDLLSSFASITQIVAPFASALGKVLGPALQGVAGYLDLVARGTEALDHLFGNTAATEAIRLREAIEHLTEAEIEGKQSAAAFADGLAHLVSNSVTTKAGIDALANAAGISGEELVSATVHVLGWARANGTSETEVRKLEDALVDQIGALGLTGNETRRLIEAYGLEGEAAEALRQATFDAANEIERKGRRTGIATKSTYEAIDAEERRMKALENVSGKQIITNDDTRDYAAALGDAASEQRNLNQAMLEYLNPAAAAASALDRLEDAQEVVTELQAEGKSGTKEYAQAMLDLAGAKGEAQAALDSFDSSGVEAGVEAFADLLGVTDDEARDLLETLGLIDGKTVKAVVIVEGKTTGSAAGFVTSSGFKGFQHGGASSQFESRLPRIIAEDSNKPELFVPRAAGQFFSNSVLERLVSGASPSGAGRGAASILVTGNTFGGDARTVRDAMEMLIEDGIAQLVTFDEAGL